MFRYINISIFTIIIFKLYLNASFAENIVDESQMKCDACIIISKRFGQSFEDAEKEENLNVLSEEMCTETIEAACDAEWKSYGVQKEANIHRLVGPGSVLEMKKSTSVDEIWERRLQDFCDELLAESPDEKTLYEAWKQSPENLDKYLCRGEKAFSACSDTKDFGPWPGDDDEDYEDLDFDYIHDEF